MTSTAYDDQFTEHPDDEDYRNRAGRAEQECAELCAKLLTAIEQVEDIEPDIDDDPYTFRIDSEIADQIVIKWALRHLKYAEDMMVHDATHSGDREQAEAVIKVFRRVLYYLTGDWSYAE